MHQFRGRAAFVTTTLAVGAVLLAFPCGAQSNRHPVVRDGKLGFIDREGREVISPQFTPLADLSHFGENGLAPVISPAGAGYIDAQGNWVIGPTMQWGFPRRFSEGIAAVLLWGNDGQRNRPAWIDLKGRVVFADAPSEGARFSEGLMSINRNGRWGYVDKEFHFRIEPQFDWAGEFAEGRASVTLGGAMAYIDSTGHIVIPYRYTEASPFSKGRARVCQGSGSARRCGFIDRRGDEVTPLIYNGIGSWDGKRFLANVPGEDPNQFAVMDENGGVVSDLRFVEFSAFQEGLAAARTFDLWGYVDHSGAWAIAPQFARAGDFQNGVARVWWKSGYGYINERGTVIWSTETSRSPK